MSVVDDAQVVAGPVACLDLRAKVAELNATRAAAKAGPSVKATEAQHAKGKLTVHELRGSCTTVKRSAWTRSGICCLCCRRTTASFLPGDPADRRSDVLVPADPSRADGMRSVIEEIVDDGDLFEVHASWAQNIICGPGAAGRRRDSRHRSGRTGARPEQGGAEPRGSRQEALWLGARA
jgi:hypothetical protein